MPRINIFSRQVCLLNRSPVKGSIAGSQSAPRNIFNLPWTPALLSPLQRSMSDPERNLRILRILTSHRWISGYNGILQQFSHIVSLFHIQGHLTSKIVSQYYTPEYSFSSGTTTKTQWYHQRQYNIQKVVQLSTYQCCWTFACRVLSEVYYQILFFIWTPLNSMWTRTLTQTPSLRPNWLPVMVHFYCFCLHGWRWRQKRREETGAGTQFGFKDGGQINHQLSFQFLQSSVLNPYWIIGWPYWILGLQSNPN